MDPLLVVSPHLDDAVLSVGQVIGSWPGATVLTIFAGRPPTGTPLSTFDENCGYPDPTSGIYRRWDEDDRALRLLGARPLRAPFIDHQYDGDRDPAAVVGEIRSTIEAVVEALDPVKIVGPLGLLHPDHALVGAAFRAAGLARLADPENTVEVWTYEEVPARVMDPDAVVAARDAWTGGGAHLDLGFLGTVDKQRKRDAVACYGSQLWALDPDLLYVDERTWRATPGL